MQAVVNLPGVESVTVVEINPGYPHLVSQYPEVASLLENPKVRIVVDDGRRWLRKNPDLRFDAVFSNTTHHFRGNATNLLSTEFMSLMRNHLTPGGTYFYNSTESKRALRTGCTSFSHGLRIASFLVVSDRPIERNTARWQKALRGLTIDGRVMFDPAKEADIKAMARVLALPNEIDDPNIAPAKKVMEDCASILRRTEGLDVMTDDNMGNEWRYYLGLAE